MAFHCSPDRTLVVEVPEATGASRLMLTLLTPQLMRHQRRVEAIAWSVTPEIHRLDHTVGPTNPIPAP